MSASRGVDRRAQRRPPLGRNLRSRPGRCFRRSKRNREDHRLAIAGETSPKEKASLQEKPTPDLVAYDLYLRAQELDRNAVTSGASVEPFQWAIPLLEEAVRRDPVFVEALALLARNHLYIYFQGENSTADPEAARRAIEQAAALKPDSGEVHRARALYHYWGERDYDAALRELALAQKELPNDWTFSSSLR